jgi:hypothetical protein
MTDRDPAQAPGPVPGRSFTVTGATAGEWLAAARAGLASVPRADTDERFAGLPPAPASTASPARIYDYLLGGKDNYAADRLAAQRAMDAIPEVRRVARANRRFLVRAVRYAAGRGIQQFIDLGTGFPTSPNVHEVARQTCPGAKVIYCDNDPVVTAHNRALRATAAGVHAIDGDIRDPHQVLADPELVELIDFTAPVAVLFVAVLHFVEPQDDPAGIVATFTERLVPGSYLIISHGVSDDTDSSALAGLARAYDRAGVPIVPRTVAEVGAWFDGFKLIRPGLVDVTRWYPDRTAKPGPVRMVAGAGRRL